MEILNGFIFCLSILVVTINCETFIECHNKPYGEYLPGQNGCRSYIFCNGDSSYEGNCPVGLSFNPVDGTCDDPSNVDCSDEIITTTPSKPTPVMPEVVCPLTDEDVVFVSNPQSCSNYYMCFNGNAMPMTCSNDLHFNSLTQECESPESANCKIVETTTPPTIATTTHVAPPTWSPTTNFFLPTPKYSSVAPPTPTTTTQTTLTWPATQTENPTGTTSTLPPSSPATPPTPVSTPTSTGYPTEITPTLPPSSPATPPTPIWTPTSTGNPTGTTPTLPPSSPATPPTPIWTPTTTGYPTGTTPTLPPSSPATPPTPVWTPTTTGYPTGTTWVTPTIWLPTQTGTTSTPTFETEVDLDIIISSTTNRPCTTPMAARLLCIQQTVGLFEYPYDCHYFYRCIDGLLTKHECPSGFGWDNKKKSCAASACST